MVMEPQIHFIEKEAYSSVLKAFIAQSDLLSWGKEGLITDLRKELNVTDREHGELLVKINSDGTIKLIREWRKRAIHAQKLLSTEANSHCFPPNSVGNSSQKKVKNSHALILDSQKHLPHGQPASTFLPSPVTAILRDDQCSSKLVMLPGNPRPSVQEVGYKSHLLSKRKGRGPGKPKSEKGFHETNSCNTKKKSDFIKIRDTEKLLYQVEWSFCSRKKPDPIQVEKAKLALREQERSILEALDELADISDDDCSLNQPQHHCSQEKLPGNGRE